MKLSATRSVRKSLAYAREHPVVAVAGGVGALALVGGAVYAISTFSGDNVVIHTADGEGAGEFRTSAARIGGALGASIYPAHNAQDILNAIRQHRRIKNLILIGHGTTTAFLRPGSTGIRVGRDDLPTWVSTQTFAREVGPRMSMNGWIGWAGCSSASNPGESDWSTASYGPGGERSFIAQIRDEMARTPGTLWGINMGGHTAPGHVSANPGARECPVSRSQIGQPCASVLDQTWGSSAYQTRSSAWVSAFQGGPAEAWISSGEVAV
jgi:hypothetical protein